MFMKAYCIPTCAVFLKPSCEYEITPLIHSLSTVKILRVIMYRIYGMPFICCNQYGASARPKQSDSPCLLTVEYTFADVCEIKVTLATLSRNFS